MMGCGGEQVRIEGMNSRATWWRGCSHLHYYSVLFCLGGRFQYAG